jgi:hypothetical protein
MRKKVRLIFADKEPYLVSDDRIPTTDKEIMFMIGNKFVVGCFDDFVGSPIKWVKKIVATPNQIGYHFVKGMLHHDRAFPDGENTLEEIHPDTLQEIADKGGKCEIEVRFAYVECHNYDGKHLGKDCSCKCGDFRDVYKPLLVEVNFTKKVIIYSK